MGKTVPSYRMALEFEINNWKGFRKTLQSDEEKQAFDELMDMCRNNGMASQNACNPVIFEPMVMSILLSHQKKLRKLEHNLTVSDKPVDDLPNELNKGPQCKLPLRFSRDKYAIFQRNYRVRSACETLQTYIIYCKS